jgi:adenine-specific DNA-methyltransferase
MTRVESCIGSRGWLSISLLTAASHAQTEDHLVATALVDDGSLLDDEVTFQLFSCDALLGSCSSGPPSALFDEHGFAINAALQAMKDSNHKYFGEEFDKIELWASDLKNVLDKELSDLEQKMSEEMRASALSSSPEERLDHTRIYHRLERQRNDRRKKIFEAQDDIYAKRDAIITDLEKSLQITDSTRALFTIRFEIVGV